MNPGISQCKNCWKWGYSAGICRIQGTKCIKCNGLHQTIHYREFTWCCKTNDKINSHRPKTKKGKPCSYSFRCSNCKGNHQADSMNCPFWKHHFNKEWHSKEYAKVYENQKGVNLFNHEHQQDMIYKEIKIFSQNIWKNSLIINTILEVKTTFNIIFIQELS